MNIEFWMGKARESIKQIQPGTKFVVKELFEGYEWNSLPKGDRLSFGRSFKNAVDNGQFAGVKHIGKRPNNSAEYLKS